MQSDHIDFRTLECFAAVAEELSFARAAQRLAMSQPPLTKRIQALEARLGVVLLDRTTRRVALTVAGSALLEETRRLFAQSQAMQRAVRGVHDVQSGTLRVGFIGGGFLSAIQPQLPRLTAALGPVEYVWMDLPAPQQVRGLIAGEIDLGFVHIPVEPAGLRSVVVADEACVVALARTHRLAARKWLRLRDLADEPFVSFPRELAPEYADRIGDAFRAAGVVPGVRHHARHFLTLLLLPASGFGVAIVPESARRLTIPGLVLRPIRGVAPRAELRMLWNDDNPSPMARRVIDLVAAGFFKG